MKYEIDLTHASPKKIYPLNGFSDMNPNGDSVDFNNYYFEKNGKPFAGISAEMHFSRTEERLWEDDLIKLKMCGVNIIATYLFWNIHEEREGVFDFSGRRNVRKFVKLCQKHGFYVIMRIGPFCHGEVRNGGVPDWIYGKPFDARSMNEGWLSQTRKLYTKYMEQLDGLFFADGGPIIGIQVENEYMHSSAPWEMTSGLSNEWVPGGDAGDAMMLELKKIALECGAKPAFFTCTGWGGASTPEGFMPLWGGYAFRPWLFYSHKGEHPATEEYLYQDYHNNQVKSIGYDAGYDRESLPYACCEMGGGMTCSYYYRFILPYKSVDAMANIKLGSGCNFLGYYMAVGGTNPKTGFGGFLNEGQVPKMSYDYQAAIGEYGQVRESYRRLKAMHMFLAHFGELLCPMGTCLPGEADQIVPEDVETLRYSVRTNGTSGFLFLNNYQDHVATQAKKDDRIVLHLPGEDITFENISLAPDENCILPFRFQMNQCMLKWATAQLFARNKDWYVFLAPEGMTPIFAFDHERVELTQGKVQIFTVAESKILVLPRAIANDVYCVWRSGQMYLIYSEAAILPDEDGIRLESSKSMATLRIFDWENAGWKELTYRCPDKKIDVILKKVGQTRYTIELSDDFMCGVKDVRLQLDYIGDIGQAFLDGDMIADNFCNGAVWEIGLASFAERMKTDPITIYITPLRENANVNVESAMAARMEEVSGVKGELISAKVQCVYEMYLNWKEIGLG